MGVCSVLKPPISGNMVLSGSVVDVAAEGHPMLLPACFSRDDLLAWLCFSDSRSAATITPPPLPASVI
ncbi:unnamed protein product [Boreogadus saida]